MTKSGGDGNGREYMVYDILDGNIIILFICVSFVIRFSVSLSSTRLSLPKQKKGKKLNILIEE